MDLDHCRERGCVRSGEPCRFRLRSAAWATCRPRSRQAVPRRRTPTGAAPPTLQPSLN